MTKYILPAKVDRGKGQPIVLLYGLGNNHKSWSYVFEQLDYTKSRVVAFDLLGFGDAPKPRNVAYTPADHAKAVIDTLESMQLTDVILAGHSMGCIVAIEVAKQRPDLIKNLKLFGAPLYKKKPRGDFWSKITRSEGVYFTIFSILKDNPELTIEGIKAVKALAPLLKGMEITEETWPAFKASLNNTIMQFESYKDALSLEKKTLLVYGILDFFIIRRNLKEIAHHNHHYISFKTTLGPHEITPRQGKFVAGILQ